MMTRQKFAVNLENFDDTEQSFVWNIMMIREKFVVDPESF
jgi:hypothetical protein